MENIDSLKLGDLVTVTIFGPDNSILFKTTKNGFHSLESAVENAISESNLDVSPKDCVFEVKNDSTGVSHRYRLNAHGHLKLII